MATLGGFRLEQQGKLRNWESLDWNYIHTPLLAMSSATGTLPALSYTYTLISDWKNGTDLPLLSKSLVTPLLCLVSIQKYPSMSKEILGRGPVQFEPVRNTHTARQTISPKLTVRG